MQKHLMFKFVHVKTALILLCFLLSGPALAQSKEKPIDKTQAAKKAQQAYKGKVLKVDQNKGKYRVKVLQKSGRVVSVDVDKKSGNVSSRKKSKKGK